MIASFMPSIVKGSKVVQSFVVKNSATILTTLGVCTLGAAIVSTYKAAISAHDEIVKMKKELEDKRTSQDEETLKRIKKAAYIKVAKIMIVPILFALMCAGCIVGNNYIHLRKQAALAAAYALSEQTIKDYEESLEPVVGRKKAELIQESVAHKDVARNASTDPSMVWDTGKGDTLFYDPKVGLYFRSNHDSVRLAFSDINNKINNFKNRSEETQLQDIYKGLCYPKHVQDCDTATAYGYCSGETVGVNLNVTGTSAWDEPYIYLSYHPHLLDADMTL